MVIRPKPDRHTHLHRAGARLWVTGRATEAEARAWCADNALTPAETQWVLDGRWYAEELKAIKAGRVPVVHRMRGQRYAVHRDWYDGLWNVYNVEGPGRYRWSGPYATQRMATEKLVEACDD